MAELYVDGQWVVARAGGRREIRCPADGSLVAEVDEAGAGGHRGRDRGRRRRLPRRRLAGHARAGAGRPAAAGGGPARAGHRDRRRARVAGHRQAPGGERVRPRRRDLRLPPLRQGRRRGGGAGGRHRQPRRGQQDRARAGGRLRAHHAVELPAAAGLLEGRAVPGGRQHLRAQAQRAHAAQRDPPDEAPRGGGPARRAWPTSSSAAAPRRGRRCPRTPAWTWCRSPVGWPPAGRIMAAAAGTREEDRPRARGQEPQHRLRRCRPRGRPRLRADRGLPALRPGLLGRGPPARAGLAARRLRRRARRARRPRSGSADPSTRRPRPAR